MENIPEIDDGGSAMDSRRGVLTKLGAGAVVKIFWRELFLFTGEAFNYIGEITFRRSLKLVNQQVGWVFRETQVAGIRIHLKLLFKPF
jgi:hypothetical protein